MVDEFPSLTLYELEPGATFFRPYHSLPAQLKISDPAVQAMTDLREVRAMTIGPGATVDAAVDKMTREQVHMLLVVDTHGEVIGLITRQDLQGEKPLKLSIERRIPHEDVRVRDIMTFRNRVQVLHIDDVLKAQVGNIVNTFKYSKRYHLVVTDIDPITSKVAIRGIFSANQIAKQLGTSIDIA